MYTTPITSPEQAEAFLTLLHEQGKSFHPDDSPATIVDMAGRFIFTPQESTLIEKRMNEVFEHLTDPYEFILNLEGI